MIGVLQVYARDVPELPFPHGTDLFQLLWCPNNHDEPLYGPRPVAAWRHAVSVTEPHTDPPPEVTSLRCSASNSSELSRRTRALMVSAP